MKKSHKITITLFLGFLLFFSIWRICGREIYLRSIFAEKICKNLVSHFSIPEDQCVLSNDVVTVMENTFPIGTDIQKVEYGMEGFEIILESSGKSEKCNHWKRIEYLLIPRWFLLFDENVGFVFCDGKLEHWQYLE